MRRRRGMDAERVVRGMPRVLVVDDEDAVREVLVLALRSLGCEVAEAESGERALDIVPGFRPDVVCLDLWMEGMPGLDVLEVLKHKHHDLAVVIVSADPFSDTMSEAKARGAAGYISKPFKLAELRSALQSALRGKPST